MWEGKEGYLLLLEYALTIDRPPIPDFHDSRYKPMYFLLYRVIIPVALSPPSPDTTNVEFVTLHIASAKYLSEATRDKQ